MASDSPTSRDLRQAAQEYQKTVPLSRDVEDRRRERLSPLTKLGMRAADPYYDIKLWAKDKLRGAQKPVVWQETERDRREKADAQAIAKQRDAEEMRRGRDETQRLNQRLRESRMSEWEGDWERQWAERMDKSLARPRPKAQRPSRRRSARRR